VIAQNVIENRDDYSQLYFFFIGVREFRFTPFHTHFCKRKKEKKESRLALWRVSKKQVLRVKYHPYASLETLSGCGCIGNVRVEILSGTEGLNLLF
jgi:hypothetical protein